MLTVIIAIVCFVLMLMVGCGLIKRMLTVANVDGYIKKLGLNVDPLAKSKMWKTPHEGNHIRIYLANCRVSVNYFKSVVEGSTYESIELAFPNNRKSHGLTLLYCNNYLRGFLRSFQSIDLLSISEQEKQHAENILLQVRNALQSPK